MTDSELLTRWGVGIALAGVVVLVVAILLVRIVAEARGILAAARRCLSAVRGIQENVEPLWGLSTTNQVAERIAGGAHSVEAMTRQLADAVGEQQSARSATGA